MLCSAPPAETVDDRLLDTEELARRRRTEGGDIFSRVKLLRYLTDGPLRRRVTAGDGGDEQGVVGRVMRGAARSGEAASSPVRAGRCL
ncbi:hypothetical protein [Streptomyces sp. A1-5]|uniref:hypothetical protein n=1 Tax=Streptomyces sp. A1-5 TaxID=2738410 RepID=UPI001F32022F|nr:hypothetical protein [Streptomyces sp. A1-5]UJB40117.1 hypothetical protein HRD51_03795 [Streptomyces sp. A1-5]